MRQHNRSRRPNNASTPPRAATRPPEGVFCELMPEIRKSLAAQGYVTPTPIQQQCIPALLAGRDALGSAQTGTGKTAAFTLPMLQRLTRHESRPRSGTPRALILAPTRELAAQIGASIETYGRFLRLRHTVIFGGVNQQRQVNALRRGVDIVVATPGRLLDLMGQGHIRLDEVEIFVLDEVDRMLDMGFVPDIRKVVARIPKKRQSLFFSATMPDKIAKLAQEIVHDPVKVTIAPDKPAVERIQQKVLFVGKKDKNTLLVSLLRDSGLRRVVVFTQMKHVANRVVQALEAAGIRSVALHGNKSQGARTKALTGFKQGRYRVLVATDVAARGLDVDGITHVINYDLPTEAETYVHRIGRTARAGAGGDAISFCSAMDRGLLREIEQLLGKPVPADTDHELHCDEAFHSKQPASAARTRGGGNGQHRGGSQRGGRAPGGYRPGSRRSRGRGNRARNSGGRRRARASD